LKNKSHLPDKNSPSAQLLIDRYLICDSTEIDRLAKGFKYKTRTNFTDAMRRQYGVNRNPQTIEFQEPIINIPEINILKYESKTGIGSPETQGLVLGDWHYGEITPTFNPKVADTRLDNLFKSAMRINELHRHIYPVNDLVIFLVGDMTHGENPYQGAKVGSIQQGAVDQVFDLAFPKLLSLVCSFRENFATVRVIAVPGNHGRISRESPDTSNFDLMLYKALSKANLPDGITIELPNDFCQIIDVYGIKFFVHHGDAVRMTNGVPYFAQVRKSMSWYITYGGFSYIIQGHIHKDDYYRLSAKTKQITNGALVSDDPYALRTIGTSTIPSQTTFGIHARKGVTWYYSLTLDDDYFPREAK